MATKRIRVLGGGPAGSAAAISALNHGAVVELVERSKLPRHKVCGEFLSPGAVQVLRTLGVWDEVAAVPPAPITSMELAIGNCRKSCPLAEPAFGLSRYALDALLLEKAVSLGARMSREVQSGERIDILAAGRKDTAPRGRRLFGFKAHFHGPATSAVELFFSPHCYVGLAPVEGG